MESKYDLGNILQPNVELHQAEEEDPNGLNVGEDPKTAFLTELKELLEKYNAMITVMRPTQGNPILTLESEDFKVFYTTFPCIYTSITPSNIFDYDK